MGNCLDSKVMAESNDHSEFQHECDFTKDDLIEILICFDKTKKRSDLIKYNETELINIIKIYICKNKQIF